MTDPSSTNQKKLLEEISALKQRIQELEKAESDRKRAEEVLRESQRRFQALVETTNDFIWDMNPHDVYTYCSPKADDLGGLQPEELLGKTPFELLPPEEKEQVAKLFTAFLRTASSFTNMEIRSFDSYGQVKYPYEKSKTMAYMRRSRKI